MVKREEALASIIDFRLHRLMRKHYVVTTTAFGTREVRKSILMLND